MDPLSITLSVISLLNTCSTVYTTLKDLYDAAASADTRVTVLLTEVATFSQVIQLLKDTLERDQVRTSLQATGHIGSHWNNLATLLVDCETILGQLQETLEAVNKSVSVLNGTRKHFRLKSAFGEIGLYQQQIRSYRDTLQLSLQTAILWNQVTFRESTDQILPSLDELYQTIRKIATDINSRMTSLENAVDERSDDDRLLKLSNQRDCMRSAASIVSSASTTLGVSHPNTGSSYGSDFGDVFPSEPSEAMRRWISSHTVYEFEQYDEGNDVLGKSDAQPPNDSIPHLEVSQESQSDSDNDLETEIIHSLLKRAQQSLSSQDFEGARRLFLNCINRISRGGSTISRRRKTKFHEEIMRPLLLTYQMQEKWEEARGFLMKQISAASSRGVDDQIVFADMLFLVDVLIRLKAYAEALLYGRRAFKGYRKLGPAGTRGVEDALILIIRVCDEDGNYDDRDAYAAMLSDLQDRVKIANISTSSVSSADKEQKPPLLVPPASFFESNLSSDAQDTLDNHVAPNPHILGPVAPLLQYPSQPALNTNANVAVPLQNGRSDSSERLEYLGELDQLRRQIMGGVNLSREITTFEAQGSSTEMTAFPEASSTQSSRQPLVNEYGPMSQLSMDRTTLLPRREEMNTDHVQYPHRPRRQVKLKNNLEDWIQTPSPKRPKESNLFRPRPPISNSTTALQYLDTGDGKQGPRDERLGKTHNSLKGLKNEKVRSAPKTIGSQRQLRAHSSEDVDQEFLRECQAMEQMRSKKKLLSTTSQIQPVLSKSTSNLIDRSNSSASYNSGAGSTSEIQGGKMTSPTFDDFLVPIHNKSWSAPYLAVPLTLADPEPNSKRKVLIVGDSDCGKTTLSIQLSKGIFTHVNSPTIFQQFPTHAQIDDGTIVDMDIWDTAGVTDYDRLRPYAYPNTDVVLICFAINWPDSFANVLGRWIPEVRRFTENEVPYMIVGLKKDLRYDGLTIDELRKYSERPVTHKQATVLANEIDASCYMECSAMTGEGVQEILAAVARLALAPNGKAKKWKRNLLGKLVGMRFN